MIFAKVSFDNALVDRIEQAWAHSANALTQHDETSGLNAQLGSLTERGNAVMSLMLGGLPNKLVADHRVIYVYTVDVHWAEIFDKTNVKSAVDLRNLLRKAAV